MVYALNVLEITVNHRWTNAMHDPTKVMWLEWHRKSVFCQKMQWFFTRVTKCIDTRRASSSRNVGSIVAYMKRTRGSRGPGAPSIWKASSRFGMTAIIFEFGIVPVGRLPDSPMNSLVHCCDVVKASIVCHLNVRIIRLFSHFIFWQNTVFLCHSKYKVQKQLKRRDSYNSNI